MLTQLFADFLKHGRYLRNWSPRTVHTYGQGLNAFQQSLGVSAQPTSDGSESCTGPTITKAQLDAFVIWMRERGLTPGGCNMYIRTVNSFLSWLHEERGHPLLRIKLLPDPQKPLRGFSDAEIRALTTFKPKGAYQTRTWTLLLVLLDTGARIDEILGLRTQDVDFDSLLLTLHGKGSKIRRVPFSLEARKLLFRYSQRRKNEAEVKSQLFFCTRTGLRTGYRNIYRDIKVLAARAGVEGEHVHPHAFRHAFAVNFIRRGGDIYRLARILGHASVQTTQLYVRSMTVEQVAEAHYSPLMRRA